MQKKTREWWKHNYSQKTDFKNSYVQKTAKNNDRVDFGKFVNGTITRQIRDARSRHIHLPQKQIAPCAETTAYGNKKTVCDNTKRFFTRKYMYYFRRNIYKTLIIPNEYAETE